MGALQKRRGKEELTFLAISGEGGGFPQVRLFCGNCCTGPFNLLKSPSNFTNTLCESTCLCTAPSLSIVDWISPMDVAGGDCLLRCPRDAAFHDLESASESMSS